MRLGDWGTGGLGDWGTMGMGEWRLQMVKKVFGITFQTPKI